MARTKPWKVCDAVWERAQPLLPSAPLRKVGRPRGDDRAQAGAVPWMVWKNGMLAAVSAPGRL